MRHVGDITKLRGWELPTVDCVAGGSPCQNLSAAGNGEGLDGEQSKLFFEQIRVVKELRQHDAEYGRTGQLIRPRWMVWENVPGAFSSNGGRDFQAVLSEIVRIAEPTAPDVPMPKGGVAKGGMPHVRAGKVECCLESTRRSVLGSAPAKKEDLSCRRFWRARRTRSTL